jgi:hypothetical protein
MAGMSGGGMTGGGMGGASSGAAGMSGMGGGGGIQSAGSCAFSCDEDMDCFTAYDMYTCDPDTHRCQTEPLSSCDVNDDCVPSTSHWFTPCTSDSGCSASQACIAVRGGGRCATKAAAGPTCSETGTAPASWPRFGAEGSVVVCEDASGRCDRGSCRDNCAAQGCAVSDRGSVCITATGLCGCNAPADCAGVPGGAVCNTSTHLCECVDSDDCNGVAGANVCVNGRCGCSGPSVCEALNPGYYGAVAVCD